MDGGQTVDGLGTLRDVDDDGHEGEAKEEGCAGQDQDSVSEREGDANCQKYFTSISRLVRGP